MPSPNLDWVDDDYLIFDKLLTVSITQQDHTTTVTGKRALKETISHTSEQQGESTVHVLRCRWHLFVNDLNGTVPEEHGYITDPDGTKHYIDDIDFATWDTRFVCQTTAEAAGEF